MPTPHIHIHIDSPYLTVEEFANRSGIPLRTVKKRILDGELPADSLALVRDKASGCSRKYVNMIKLNEMAASSPFVHPRLNTNIKPSL